MTPLKTFYVTQEPLGFTIYEDPPEARIAGLYDVSHDGSGTWAFLDADTVHMLGLSEMKMGELKAFRLHEIEPESAYREVGPGGDPYAGGVL